MEEHSRRAYLELSQSSAPGEVRNLLGTLAVAEEEHKALLLEAWQSDSAQKDSLELRSVPFLAEGGVTPEEFTEELRSCVDDPAALLEVVMGMEVDALDLYLTLAEHFSNDKGCAALFRRIADGESEHLERLGALIASS